VCENSILWNETPENQASEERPNLALGTVGKAIQVPEGRPSSHAHSLAPEGQSARPENHH
jgi:hypothetical protein